MLKKAILSSALLVVGLIPAYNVNAQSAEDETVAVYRWYNSRDKDNFTVVDQEIADGTLMGWGYKEKTFLFYGFRNPGPDRVAVYRWYNQRNNDWVSVAEDEFTEGEMILKGYSDKNLQFYAPIRRGGDKTVAVYRWMNPDTQDWVTIPDGGDTDKYFKKGLRRKIFQFYGMSRQY